MLSEKNFYKLQWSPGRMDGHGIKLFDPKAHAEIFDIFLIVSHLKIILTSLDKHITVPWPESHGSCGPHVAHLGPVSPRWAPCRPHEPCYEGYITL